MKGLTEYFLALREQPGIRNKARGLDSMTIRTNAR